MKPLAFTEISLAEDLGRVRKQPIAKDLFSINNVDLFYGDFRALFNITLNIPRGGIFALIGPSGCGKSSLLHIMARLTDTIPGARVNGQVLLKGLDLYQRTTDTVSLRRQLGYVFQKPTPFPFSIYRNMELVLKEHGIKEREEVQSRIQLAFEQVGLWEEVKDRLNKPALSLSGGQQQRLCIARALLLKPDTLLMDEPCSALDPMASAVIEELIVELGKSHTVVLVTHNLAQAKRTADRVAFFWTEQGAGTLVETGLTEQVFKQPQKQLTAAYVNGVKG